MSDEPRKRITFTFEQRQRLTEEIEPMCAEDPEYAASEILRLEIERDDAQAETERLRAKRQTYDQHDCMYIEEELAWTKEEIKQLKIERDTALSLLRAMTEIQERGAEAYARLQEEHEKCDASNGGNVVDK